ncbi:MAG TPA: STM3941 family protein [Mucilaginibacter sp.]|jgi:hypothetical protein|nr:STM3941 family protein [Mucilaginibacter sp.]
MPEVKLYKSRWKAISLILLCLPFVIASLYFLSKNDSDKTMNWFGLCFFGLGIPLGLFGLFDRRPELILDDKGIFDRLSYGIFDKGKDKAFVSWHFIKNVYLKEFINSYSKQLYICIEIKEEMKTDPKYCTNINKFSHLIGLSDYNIPLMNLKVNKQELLSLIQELSVADATERKNLLTNSDI